MVTTKGRVYSCGSTASGHDKQQRHMRPVPALSEVHEWQCPHHSFVTSLAHCHEPAQVCVVQAACGDAHTACVTRGGNLYTWGDGADGRLGHKGRHSAGVPMVVSALRAKQCVSVACGERHTMVRTANASLYVFGSGRGGQVRGSSTVGGTPLTPLWCCTHALMLPLHHPTAWPGRLP